MKESKEDILIILAISSLRAVNLGVVILIIVNLLGEKISGNLSFHVALNSFICIVLNLAMYFFETGFFPEDFTDENQEE